jgi:uncharacterized membrane protein YkoI
MDKQKIIMRTSFSAIALCGLCVTSAFPQKKLTLKDLPPAVQKTVEENLKGGEIKAIDREKEKGVTQYEIESILNGKHRDFNVDTKGNLVETEEEISIESIPAPAKAAILKKAGGGKVGTVEVVAKGGAIYYEAAFTTKNGTKSEVLVKPDGTETKD